MRWDPAEYDNITVMRVLYADIWNPGKTKCQIFNSTKL
jgi:hypothetical protein